LQFVGNGVVGPFLHGQKTGTGSVESGGDGGYAPFGTAITEFRNGTVFGRYNLNNDTNFYIQGSGSGAFATGTWYPTNMVAGANTASIFRTDNPFLSADLQNALNPANTPDKTLQLTKFINQFGRYSSPGRQRATSFATSRRSPNYPGCMPMNPLRPDFGKPAELRLYQQRYSFHYDQHHG
jgi:hypothetical protein